MHYLHHLTLFTKCCWSCYPHLPCGRLMLATPEAAEDTTRISGDKMILYMAPFNELVLFLTLDFILTHFDDTVKFLESGVYKFYQMQ